MQAVIDIFIPRFWQDRRRAAPWRMLLICCGLAITSAAAQQSTLTGEALVQALRDGGYTMYFRHAATDWSQTDQVNQAGDLTSCDPNQIRQLSDEGRRVAQFVGEAIRALAIPIGRVLSSPYCRCKETAELMGLGSVEITGDLMNLRVAEYFGGRDAIVERARRQLGSVPAPGTNTVLVSHGNLARAATSVYPGEGEGLIFQPQEGGGFVFVGRLDPTQWRQLAASLSP